MFVHDTLIVPELRYVLQRPVPAEPWDDVLNATSLPTLCVQSDSGVIRYTHPWYQNYGEDCLNLNVFAPVVISSVL